MVYYFSIEHAFQLIKIAKVLLTTSLPPRRSFMPLYVNNACANTFLLICHRFFLVNAAHITILGDLWKLKQSKSFNTSLSVDQSREFAAIDESTKILDFCGQRNVFARKYSKLIKDLRLRLSQSQPSSAVDSASPLSVTTHVSSLDLNQYTPIMPSSRASQNPEFMPSSQEGYQDMDFVQDPGSTLTNENTKRIQNTALGPLEANGESWAEEFGVFYPSTIATYGKP